MSLDMNQKRGVFIGKVNSLMQEFRFALPQVLLNLVHTYACNIYGSNIWDLFSQDCERLSKSYNVTVRNILNHPRTTHRYLIEPLTDKPHLYVQLLARYVTFGNSLLSNDAFPVRFLTSLSTTDMRTILGRTLTKISNMCGLSGNIDNLSAKIVKERVKYMSIPKNEVWRLGVIDDMRGVIESDSVDRVISHDEAKSILEYVCVT